MALLLFAANHADWLWCGWNNNHYDDYILAEILSFGTVDDVWKVNHMIVVEKLNLGFANLMFPTFDMMKAGFTVGGVGVGLKRVEFSMGLNIDEFEFDGNLKPDEKQRAIDYCWHDVYALEAAFEENIEWLHTHEKLIEYFDMPHDAYRWSIGSVFANGLKMTKTAPLPEETVVIPECFNHLPDICKDFFTEEKNKTKTVDVRGVPHKLAWGGIHGAKPKFYAHDNLWHIDVGSFYPTTIINNKFFTRMWLHKLEDYKVMVDDRLAMKKVDPVLANALKRALNSVYGLLKNEYSKFYDMTQQKYVSMFGQLVLIDLIYRLPDSVELVQSNTDGIYVQGDYDVIEPVVKQWAEEYKYTVDIDAVGKIFQRDVNNYILQYPNGKIKVKGVVAGYQLSKYKPTFGINSGTIIDDCIVDYLLYGITPETTVNNCNDAIKFQLLASYSKDKFDYQTHNGFKQNRVTRCYASKNLANGTVYKWKEGRPHKIAGLPMNCFIDNEACDKFNNWDELDRQWYIDEAYRKIEEFRNV